VSLDDRGYEVAESLSVIGLTAGVVHLDAATLAPDEAGFSQDPEVLGERGLRDRAIAHFEERRAYLRAIGARDFGEDMNADGIRQRVDDSFNGDVLDRRVKERPHHTRLSHRLTRLPSFPKR
jgi:hypothetical protein